MRTLEISAQFLALLQIPHATLRRSLHLSALHFPSAKFGERDPPSGLVCWVESRHRFYSLASAVQERTLSGEGAGQLPRLCPHRDWVVFQNRIPPRLPRKGGFEGKQQSLALGKQKDLHPVTCPQCPELRGQ